jgi:hypothetical protein
VLPEAATGIALDPNGTRLAYLADSGCVFPQACTGTCASAGIARFSPNVLVVLDLRTGASVRTTTDNPGHPLGPPSWSPDGHRLLADYRGDQDQLFIFDGDHPNFASATRLKAAHGCGYRASLWTSSGIVAALNCGTDQPLSPTKIVRFDAGGHLSLSWPLPACINGLTIADDGLNGAVIVQAGIGYGMGKCQQPYVNRFAKLLPTGLSTILDLPKDNVWLQR